MYTWVALCSIVLPKGEDLKHKVGAGGAEKVPSSSVYEESEGNGRYSWPGGLMQRDFKGGQDR